MLMSPFLTMMVGLKLIEANVVSFDNCLYFLSVVEFQFSQPSFDVSEDSGVVSVCLELISGILTEDVIIEVMVLGDRGMSGCKLN